MVTKATNHQRAIITISSKQIQLAQSKGKPLQYHKKLKSGGPIPKDNHIETCKCSPTQSCTHTKVGGSLVIHNESKIGHPFSEFPSWYDDAGEMLGAPPVGDGLKGGEVQFFAKAFTKSPDVMVEGKWLVREHDAAELDNNSGYGEFVYKDSLTKVPDDDDLIFAQCGVEKLKIECKHGPEAKEGGGGGGGKGESGAKGGAGGEKRFVMMGVDPKTPHAGTWLECFIGDTVTITAYRLNASETDPAKRSETRCDFAYYKEKRGPLPEGETQHAAFTIVRNKHVLVPGVSQAWEEKTETKVGKNTKAKDEETQVNANVSILTLGEEWLLKPPKSEEAKNKEARGFHLDRDAQTEALEKRTDERRQALSASDKVDGSIAKHQANEKAVQTAENKEGDARATAFLIDSYKTLGQLIDWQPLILTINSHGCSKGPVGIIHAFPPGEATVNLWTLTDWPLKVAFDKIKNGISKISGWLKQINGTRVAGHGVPDEAPTASVEGGGFTISFYFMQRSQVSHGDGGKPDTTPRSAQDFEPKFELSTEWKELTRDSQGSEETPGLKQWMVKRAWGLEVGVEKLLGLSFTYEVSLLKLSFLAPIQTLLEQFGIKVGPYIAFKIELSCGIAGSAERNEYGKWGFKKGDAPVSATLSIRVFIRLSSAAEAGIETTGEWKAEFGLKKNEKDQFCVYSAKKDIIIKIDFYANVDIGIWSGSVHYDLAVWDLPQDEWSRPLQ